MRHSRTIADQRHVDGWKAPAHRKAGRGENPTAKLTGGRRIRLFDSQVKPLALLSKDIRAENQRRTGGFF